MPEDFNNVDYYDTQPECDIVMYCTNPKCRHQYGTYEIHEWETNAHFLSDDAYTCPECNSEGQEEKPNFEEEDENAN